MQDLATKYQQSIDARLQAAVQANQERESALQARLAALEQKLSARDKEMCQLKGLYEASTQRESQLTQEITNMTARNTTLRADLAAREQDVRSVTDELKSFRLKLKLLAGDV